MKYVALPALVALMLVACAMPREPVPITPPGDTTGAAVIRRTIPEPAPTPPPAAVAIAKPSPPAAPPPIVVPPNTQYVCVSETAGERKQTAIEFSPKVAQLCQKHPEMGPCQYERDLCRRSGGRVYAADGAEITPQTEAEYDKKVMRVRFKAN